MKRVPSAWAKLIDNECETMTLEEKIRHYFENMPHVAAVYLFGSRANRQNRADSDVDLGILMHSDSTDEWNAFLDKTLVELSRITRKDIHPVHMNAAGETLLRQVFSKGKPLVVNDAEKLSRFRTNAYVRIAEFGYYRDIMQKGFVRKVMSDCHG